jgi:hypothetical protein
MIQIRTELVDSEFSCDAEEIYNTRQAYNYHMIF